MEEKGQDGKNTDSATLQSETAELVDRSMLLL